MRVEHATGRVLSRKDCDEIEDCVFDNAGFYCKCLKAYLRRQKGNVSWNTSGQSYSDEFDDEEESYDLDYDNPSTLQSMWNTCYTDGI